MYQIKITSIRAGWYIVLTLFLLVVETTSVFAQVASHPFLIVTADQFEEHREKAFYEPWKSMALDAFKITEEGFNKEDRG